MPQPVGTSVLRPAYDEIMETILLILALMALRQDGDLDAALKNVLAFWRENRALILSLTGNASAQDPTQNTQEEAKTSDTSEEKKDRPPQEDGPAVNILEEFLKGGALR